MAVNTVRGELSLRRLVLDLVAEQRIRHAHMPAITDEVFLDGLSMNYREISEFIEMLIALAEKSNSITMTSPAGTNLELNYATPLIYDKMDGLITRKRWQNLPSGQLIIYPNDANGNYVIDRNIGDWFEHKFNVTEYPVTLTIEGGKARTISCDNKRLESELGLFLRSSDNSGRISELVVGANLGLTQDRPNSLLDSYRPSASLVLGAFDHVQKVNWSSATILPPACPMTVSSSAGRGPIPARRSFRPVTSIGCRSSSASPRLSTRATCSSLGIQKEAVIAVRSSS